jgi:DNA-directed RNA polymerase specialized sigma subunit
MSRKLEYTYEFVDGNSVTLTAKGDCADERRLISEKWLELLEEMDREEKRNDHRETRRHCSMERRDPKGKYVVARTGGEDELERLITWTAFCQMISGRERYVAKKAFHEGYSAKEIAEMTGASERRIQQIISGLKEKFVKIL